MVPNIEGVTPLHECVIKTYTKGAEEILKVIGKNALDNHSKYLKEIIPDLIETCPMAMSTYFSDRLIECPWALKQTKGNLQTPDPDVEFGVLSYPLVYFDPCEIEDKLFVKETKMQEKMRNNAEQKRLPMTIQVFDFPKIHHFSNQTGKEIVLALSDSDDISIFDRKYVQALLEYQWPAIRYAIMRDLFMPYILFLTAFSYFSIF